MKPNILLFWKHVFYWAKNQIKTYTKPTNGIVAIISSSDLSRTRAELIAENAFLRQQLIIINRQIKRLQLTNRDRLSLVLLARC